jgi:spore photoproduct lyase
MVDFIKHIWIDPRALDYPLTKTILEKGSEIPQETIGNEEAIRRFQKLTLTRGKKILYLTLQKGEMVKPCPGTSPPYLCCKYTVINQTTHCPMDCTYCILQEYLDTPVISVYVNLPDIFGQIDNLLKNQPRRFFRIGTGELTDSLALDHLTKLSKHFIGYISNQKNALLELKTKTADIENLIGLPHRNTVISWSLNPQQIIKQEEFLSAQLDERLQAARKCMEERYLLGFHFDPILDVSNWEQLYRNLIDRLFAHVDGSRIVWISLGSLRYPSSLTEKIQKRFPKSRIVYEEMIKGLDGKMRYPKPLRIEIYGKIYRWLKEKYPDLFIYFCMESPDVWDKVTGSHPESNEELDFWFAQSLRQRFPELNSDEPERANYCKS